MCPHLQKGCALQVALDFGLIDELCIFNIQTNDVAEADGRRPSGRDLDRAFTFGLHLGVCLDRRADDGCVVQIELPGLQVADYQSYFGALVLQMWL